MSQKDKNQTRRGYKKKPFTKEHIKNQRESRHKNGWWKYPEKTKKKESLAIQKKWKDPIYREKVIRGVSKSSKERIVTKETREKIRKSNIGLKRSKRTRKTSPASRLENFSFTFQRKRKN